MKKICLMVVCGITISVLAYPTISEVNTKLRSPWNGLVDIGVTLVGESNILAQTTCSFVATNTATSEALPVSHITRVGSDVGSGSIWERRFVWDVNADVGDANIDDVTLTVKSKLLLGGVQLWKNGPYWAECNIGTTKPEGCGYYFSWGDIIGYRRSGGTYQNGDYINVTWVSSAGASMNVSPFNVTMLPNLYGGIDSTGNLKASHDAATAHHGAPWRMPTDEEFTALLRHCTFKWTMRNGVYGRLISGEGAYAMNSIFLPANGFGDGTGLLNFAFYGDYGIYGGCWSATIKSGGSSSYAQCLTFSSDSTPKLNDSVRYRGQQIRPIRDFVDFSHLSVHLSLNPYSKTYPDLGENPTDDQVVDAVVGSADEMIPEHITNATIYATYRSWATKVKGTNGMDAAGLETVKGSKFAWMSFALDSDTLLSALPSDEDLKIKEFAPTEVAGKYDFTVAIDGVTIGSEALKENLKQVFGLEGSTTLNADDFSMSKVDIDFGTPENGKVKFTAGPKDAESSIFFMKVKMTPE